jgi:hypothetical protein
MVCHVTLRMPCDAPHRNLQDGVGLAAQGTRGPSLVSRHPDFGVVSTSESLQNPAALQKLNPRFSRTIDKALDAYCAQLRWQDTNSSIPRVLLTSDEMRDQFFPYFER